MASPAEILNPPPMYMYLLYANFALLCAAITVGVVILLRRQATKDQMTGLGEIDYPKIASQLQKEIVRLQELRDRIYPEGAAEAAILEISRPPSSSSTSISPNDMSEDELARLSGVQNILSQKIEELTKKHEQELSSLKAQGQGASSGEIIVDTKLLAEKEELIKTNTALRQEMDELKARAPVVEKEDNSEGLKILENQLKEAKERLQEYEIFEDDLSRVKELKKEISDLKAQLGGATSSSSAQAAATALASAAIEASMMDAGAEEVSMESVDLVKDSSLKTGSSESAVTEFDEGAIEAAIESGASDKLAEEGAGESDLDMSAEFEKLLSGSQASESPSPEAPPPGFESKKVSEGPQIVTAGAPESTMGEIPEDDLMAEFEKLLGTAEKS